MSELAKLRINRESTTTESSGSGLKKLLWLLILPVLAIAVYLLYQGPLKPAKEVKVTTVIVSNPSQASSVLNASGYVVAQRKAEVASKGTGKLESLVVEEGTRVKKGQVLGRLESRDMDAALSQAKADLQVEIASLGESKSNFQRKKMLVDQKLVAESEFDLADAQYKRAIANVESARAHVRAAQVEVENTYIRAPFDGTVLTKNADVGEIVAPFGSAGNSKGSVVSMADMTSLQVEADVSESNLGRVKVGQPCEITLDAFPEKRYRGIVHMIVPTADRAKATVLTKVRFVDKDEQVLPEMSAKVAFLTEELSETQIKEKPKILVDPAAVVERQNSKVVFLVKGEEVVEKTVKVDKMVGNALEVLDGIAPGDQVVLNPDGELKNGTKIKVVS
ncbi:efflux RND transporter periplasmic adaptor subunit [bacterium]|nr:efflux RND transporter periplasmic adaptor subunit [bacterium]MCI0603873.1 efflux RND transporter periplasmic adaptor subunit [bacterium]